MGKKWHSYTLEDIASMAAGNKLILGVADVNGCLKVAWGDRVVLLNPHQSLVFVSALERASIGQPAHRSYQVQPTPLAVAEKNTSAQDAPAG